MNSLSKALKIARLAISPSKIQFRNPRHVEIVVFDRIYEGYFKQLIGGRSSLTFDPRYEDRLEVPAFIAGLVAWLLSGRKMSLTHHYFSEFLRRVKPKLILSSSYFSKDLYSGRIASRCRETNLFVFQRGVDSLKALNQAEMRRGDIFFSVSDAYSQAWQAVVAPARILTIGSLPSLLFSGAATSEHGKRVGFISQVQPDGQFEKSLGLSNKQFYEPERLCLKKIAESVEKFGGSFEILGRSEKIQERDFFRITFGDERFKFHPRSSPEDTYQRLQDFDLIISVDSMLGIEALARGFRVMFLDVERFSHRRSFWHPSREMPQVASRHLLLRFENSIRWSDQMVEVLRMSGDDYRSCVEDIFGKSSQINGLSDLQELVDSALNE